MVRTNNSGNIVNTRAKFYLTKSPLIDSRRVVLIFFYILFIILMIIIQDIGPVTVFH